jgi:Ca2+-binding EF-hand superfamily protein
MIQCMILLLLLLLLLLQLQIMQDLSELKDGHRNVPDAALDWTFNSMDKQHKGYIDKQTFVKYGKR